VSPFEEKVLFAALPQALAFKELHDGKATGDLNAEQMYELARRAGYSEDGAQKIATARGEARMNVDLPA
jgi:hypothetical protein